MKKSDFLLKEKTIKIENGFAVPLIINEWFRSVAEDSSITSLKEGINTDFMKTLAGVASETLGVNVSADEKDLEVFDKTDFGFVLKTKEFDVKVDFTYKSFEVEVDPATECVLNSRISCACQVHVTFLEEEMVSKEGKVYVEFNYSLLRDGLKVSFGIKPNNEDSKDLLSEIAVAFVNLIAGMISAVLPDLIKTASSPEEEESKVEELVD